MKKTAILLLMLSTVFFSCSDTYYYTPKLHKGPIYGKWRTISSTRSGSEKINTTDCGNINEDGLYWTFQFSTQGTFTLYNTCTNAVLERGSFTYSNGELLLDLDNTAGYVIIAIRNAGGKKITMEYNRTVNGTEEGYIVVLQQ